MYVCVCVCIYIYICICIFFRVSCLRLRAKPGVGDAARVSRGAGITPESQT